MLGFPVTASRAVVCFLDGGHAYAPNCVGLLTLDFGKLTTESTYYVISCKSCTSKGVLNAIFNMQVNHALRHHPLAFCM